MRLIIFGILTAFSLTACRHFNDKDYTALRRHMDAEVELMLKYTFNSSKPADLTETDRKAIIALPKMNAENALTLRFAVKENKKEYLSLIANIYIFQTLAQYRLFNQSYGIDLEHPYVSAIEEFSQIDLHKFEYFLVSDAVALLNGYFSELKADAVLMQNFRIYNEILRKKVIDSSLTIYCENYSAKPKKEICKPPNIELFCQAFPKDCGP